jgi:hypothetical protein
MVAIPLAGGRIGKATDSRLMEPPTTAGHKRRVATAAFACKLAFMAARAELRSRYPRARPVPSSGPSLPHNWQEPAAMFLPPANQAPQELSSTTDQARAHLADMQRLSDWVHGMALAAARP